jgi:hypothetical protein
MLKRMLIIFNMKFNMDSTDFESGRHVDLLALGFSAFINMGLSTLAALISNMGLSTWLYFPTWAALISHTGLHGRSLESAEQETGRTNGVKENYCYSPNFPTP